MSELVYLHEALTHQRIRDTTRSRTYVDMYVVHVIRVGATEWGCAYAPSRSILYREREIRETHVQVGDVIFTDRKLIHEEKIIPVYIEGQTWMSVFRDHPEDSWTKREGTDEAYMELITQYFGIPAQDIIFQSSNRMEPHVNPIPMTEAYEPIEVLVIQPRSNAFNLAIQLADALDIQGRAWFETQDSLSDALGNIRKAFPRAALSQGRSQARVEDTQSKTGLTWGTYICVVDAPPKKKRRKS